MKAAVVSFGYPIGALALATAAVHLSPPSMLTRNNIMLQLVRALSLYEAMGNDIRDEPEASGSKKSSNYRFDNKPCGIVTSNYTESTSRLSENRWEQIVQGVAQYFGQNMASSTSKLLGPAFRDEVDACMFYHILQKYISCHKMEYWPGRCQFWMLTGIGPFNWLAYVCCQ